MTPSERWPALLLQLEPDTWTRATDLAQALGVSERTVYRDVQELVEAGLPLQGVPGKGYRLPDDYLLAPVTLTVDEAIMLVLGSAYAAQNVDGRYQAAAQAAQHKINALLPPNQQERALALQGSVHLVPPSVFGTSPEDALLKRVRQALVEERSANVEQDGGTFRLHPYGLARHGTHWHVVGHRPDRGGVVHLRLTDIDALTLADDTFDRPAGYHTTPDGPEATPDRRVRMLFAADVASSVEVAPSLNMVDRKSLADGRLLLTLRVHSELEVLPWLLSWGRHVQVLAPRALRQRLADEARAVADQYESAPSLLD